MSQTSESGDRLVGNEGKENVAKQAECLRDGFRGGRLILGDVSNHLGKRGFPFDPVPEKGNVIGSKLKSVIDGADSLRKSVRVSLHAVSSSGLHGQNCGAHPETGGEIGSDERGEPGSLPFGNSYNGGGGGLRLLNVMQPFGSIKVGDDGVGHAQNKGVMGVTQAADDSRTFSSSLNGDMKGITGGEGSRNSCISTVSLTTSMGENIAGTDLSHVASALDGTGNTNESTHVVAAAQSLTSNDLNLPIVDSQESAVNCRTELCEEVLIDFIHSRTLDFGVEKPHSSHANNGTISANVGLESIKNCSCSFCLKAGFILSELHYQDFKGRIAEVKKSVRQVQHLIERGYNQGVTGELIIGEASAKQSRNLESDLMHQWKALFLHTERTLVRESSQLQSSLKKLKVVSENCKKDFEATKGASFRNF